MLGKNSRELWLDGKPIKTEPLYAGGVVFHDLRQIPQFYFNDPLDSVNYFLPRGILDAIADDAGAARISDLKFTPGVGVRDHVVEELTRLLLPAFDEPDQVSQLFADHISLALGSHIAQTYGGMASVLAPQRGGFLVLQLSIEPAVEQNQKAEACRPHHAALPCPRVVTHPRRIIQPITCVTKRPKQGGQQIVTRITILIETEVGTLAQAG